MPSSDCSIDNNVVKEIQPAPLAECAPTAASPPPSETGSTGQPAPAGLTGQAAAWSQCKELAQAPRILDRFVDVLAGVGLVGEKRAAKLVYLVVTSRFLPGPVSAVVKGVSSAGKSYLVGLVLRFFPQDAYHLLTAMSEHALVYSEEPLKHRILVIYEAAALHSDIAGYFIRSLVSEGRIRYETVESLKDVGIKPKLIIKEGPIGLLLTTTALRLHPENETRLFSIPMSDSPGQTSNVMMAIASRDEGGGSAEPEWLALQNWLTGAEHRVSVPYAPALASAILPRAVRLRRDFAAMLNLVKAHAILQQAVRERDAQGRIVAALDDYAEVRELINDLISEGVEASVPSIVRETVAAVGALTETSDEVNVTEVAKHLSIDKAAALRRVDSAVQSGYLRNLEARPGRPARLQLSEPVPAKDDEVLPPPNDPRLTGCTVDGDSGEGGTHCDSASDGKGASEAAGVAAIHQTAQTATAQEAHATL